MRLSDIFKKTAKQPQAVITEPDDSRQIKIPSIPQAIPQISPTSRTAEQAYTEAITSIKNIFSLNKEALSSDEFMPCVNSIVELIKNNNRELLILADRATPDNYLYGHSVNVCILSLFLGHALKVDRLIALGHCALLHDLGMVKLLDAALKNTKLTPQEYDMIKKHPAIGSDTVLAHTNINEELRTLVAKIMLQHHERKDGSGYPHGLTSNEIHEFARIVSICDVYEALTHPRSYRTRIIPHEGIKAIIGSTESHFDSDIVRAFVEHISLYPPGSYVKLNTDEIARVSGINKGLPTRPLVRIIFDSGSHKITEPKNIDLAATPMLFIKEPIDETKLQFQDRKLMLEMKASRWWVKGI